MNEEPAEDSGIARMVAAGASSQLVKVVRIGSWDSATLEFDQHISGLAIAPEAIWLSEQNGQLHRIVPVWDGNDLIELNIERSFDLDCDIGQLLPLGDRVWFTQAECDSGELTLAAIDSLSGELVHRQIITTRNNRFSRLVAHHDHLFVLVENAFSVVRAPIADPGNFQVLDLRPDTEGKYGTGAMALAGDSLWIMDTQRRQVIQVNPSTFQIEETIANAEAGIDFEASQCSEGHLGAYCWLAESLYRFDPSTRRVEASMSTDQPIRALAVHGDKVFAGLRMTSPELDPRSLAESGAALHSMYPDHLQIAPW